MTRTLIYVEKIKAGVKTLAFLIGCSLYHLVDSWFGSTKYRVLNEG